MKNILFIIAFMISYTGYTQKLYAEWGTNNAYFKNYTSSNGEETLNTDLSKPQEPTFGLGVLLDVFNDSSTINEFTKVDVSLMHYRHNINTSFNSGGSEILLRYNLAYLSLRTGIHFIPVKIGNFNIHLHSHISHDWLLFGSSEYANVYNDLSKKSEYDRSIFSIHYGGGFGYEVVDGISLFANYNSKFNFRRNLKDSNFGEKYTLRSTTISLGLLFNLPKKQSVR